MVDELERDDVLQNPSLSLWDHVRNIAGEVSQNISETVNESVRDRLLSRLNTSTVFSAAFAQAGVDEATADAFIERLESDPGLNTRMGELVNGILSNTSNVSMDFDSLQVRLQQAAPILSAIADNPDSFIRLANRPGSVTLINAVIDHTTAGGELNTHAGLMELTATIPTQDLIGALGSIAGTRSEQVTQFQEAIAAAEASDPRFTDMFRSSLAQQILEASASPEAGASLEGVQLDTDFFSTISRVSTDIMDYADTPAVMSLLSSPDRLSRVIDEAERINAEAALEGSETQPVNLFQFGALAAQNVVEYEAGLIATQLPPNLIGYAGMLGLGDQLRQLGQMRDTSSVSGIMGNFQFLTSMMSGQGPGGFNFGIGNMMGPQVGAAMHGVGARFGHDVQVTDTNRLFASMNNDFYFGEGNQYGYTPVDYSAIGRNVADGVWNADGSLKEPVSGEVPASFTTPEQDMGMTDPNAIGPR